VCDPAQTDSVTECGSTWPKMAFVSHPRLVTTAPWAADRGGAVASWLGGRSGASPPPHPRRPMHGVCGLPRGAVVAAPGGCVQARLDRERRRLWRGAPSGLRGSCLLGCTVCLRDGSRKMAGPCRCTGAPMFGGHLPGGRQRWGDMDGRGRDGRLHLHRPVGGVDSGMAMLHGRPLHSPCDCYSAVPRCRGDRQGQASCARPIVGQKT